MNKTKSLLIGIALLTAMVIHAQTVITTPTGLSLSFSGVTVPAIAGTPITINGQTLLIATNASGGYTVVTYGAYGTNSFTPPNTLGGVVAFTQNAVQNNNPENIGYYSTNGEWDVSLGAAYAQNSGAAAVQLAIERYGVIPSWPNASLGLAVLEGNQNGQNGTAAGYGFIDYRHPIGDVALIVGLGGGYDNFTGKPMAIAKAEVEYRQNKHLGEFAGVGYDFEGLGTTKSQTGATLNNPSGLVVAGGIRCAF